MKKTISIHIKGFPFIIEEIAYTRLENYINRLNAVLKGQQGADEIIEDIEIRIAELLNEKTTQYKTVIDDGDVVEVLNKLGDPKDYAEGDVVDEPSYSSSSTKESSERRLYRDRENGYIGGVCAGLAGYFNIDPTIIRLLWAGAFFIGGVGLFLYIILWAIIPKANSSIDRLKMKGKPINVDTVKEEVERAAQNVSEKSRHFANQVRNDSRVKEGVSTLKKVVRLGLGLFLLFIGFSALVSVITFVFGTPQFIPASTDSGFLSITSLASLIFNQPMDHQLAWISFYVCSISFITFFLLAGFVVLFSIKNKWYRYANFLLIFMGIIGFALGIIVFARTARDFAIEGEVQKEIALVNSPSLTILTKSEVAIQNSDFKVRGKGIGAIYIGKSNITAYGIPIEYHISQDSLYKVELVQSAHAHTFDKAVKRAKNIEYYPEVKNDTIILPNSYDYPVSDKFRVQDVVIHVYIPKGKTVTVEGEIIDLERKTVDIDDYDYDYEIEFVHKRQRGKIKSDGTYRHWD